MATVDSTASNTPTSNELPLVIKNGAQNEPSCALELHTAWPVARTRVGNNSGVWIQVTAEAANTPVRASIDHMRAWWDWSPRMPEEEMNEGRR